jgi:hypothetical protein
VTAGAGFLLAVLWFDLMFDVQLLRHRGHDLPDEVLGSIAAYYRRVTTTARPMNRLVAATMVTTLAAVIAEVARADHSRWVAWVSLPLLVAPILLAGARTVPSAVRLGGRSDTIAVQAGLARAVYRQHLFCFASVATLLAIQLASA